MVTRQYTYGLQRISENLSPTVSGKSTWTPSFYVYDGGGSVRQLADYNGNVTDEYEYDAYGNSFTKSGTVAGVTCRGGGDACCAGCASRAGCTDRSRGSGPACDAGSRSARWGLAE